MARSLQAFCRRTERVRRLARACRWGVTSSAIAGGAGCLAVVAARSVGWPWEPSWSLALPIAGLAAGFLGVFVLSPRRLGEAALALEEFYGLKTRFTSALAFASAAGESEGGFAEAILRDAEAKLSGLRPGAVAGWNLRWPSLSMLLAWAMLALATLYYPPLDLFGRSEIAKRQEAEQAVRRSEARKLEELARDLKPTELMAQTPGQTMDVGKELEKLADQLRQPKADRVAGMLKVSDLKQKVQQEREAVKAKALGIKSSAIKEMKTEEGRTLAAALLNKQFGDAAGQSEAMAKALREGSMPEALQRDLAGDLKKLSEATSGSPSVSQPLEAAGENLGAGRSEAGAGRMDELAGALRELARNSEKERALAQAAEALERTSRSLGQAGEKAPTDGSKGQGSGQESKAGENSKGQQGQGSEQGKSGSDQSQTGDGQKAGDGKQGDGKQGDKGSAGQKGQKGSNSSGDQGAKGQSGGEQQAGKSQSGAQQGANAQQGGQQQSGQNNSGDPQQGGQQQDGLGATPSQGMTQEAQQQQGGEGQQGQQGQQGQSGQQGGQQGQQGGQGSGSQQSQSGGGKGGQGQGQGAGTTAGEQGAGRDAGIGTTNLQGASYQAGNDPANKERNAAESRARWEEKFMRLYGERSINAKTTDSAVKGQMGPGEDVGSRTTDAKPKQQDPSVPAQDLFLETQRKEKQALDAQDIPLDYKDAVRRYFDSIEVPRR